LKRLRRKLTLAKVMVTVLALAVLGGGTAYASTQSPVSAPQHNAAALTAAGLDGGLGLSARRGSGAIPDCPSLATPCHFEIIHFDGFFCPSFTAYGGGCNGYVNGIGPWKTSHAWIRWSDQAGSRHFIIWGKPEGSGTDWELPGWLPGSGYADFSVDRAWNDLGGFPEIFWHTENGTGAPGTQNGPLHLNFESGNLGADVYIYGYLYPGPERPARGN
jgi:hypothetical protein